MGQIEDARKGLEELTRQEPRFVEAHVTLATVYYRLKRKSDADRERAIVQKLNDEIQAQQPGVKGTTDTCRECRMSPWECISLCCCYTSSLPAQDREFARRSRVCFVSSGTIKKPRTQ